MNIFFLLLSFALAYTPPEEKPSFSLLTDVVAAVTRVLISRLVPKTRYAVLSMALYVCRSPTVLTAT